MRKNLSAKPILKFISLVIILAALYYLGSKLDFSLEAIRERISEYPIGIGFVVFSILYAFVSVAPMPGRDVFKLLGAVIWGWWISTLFVFVGEMLAAVVGFVLARLLGKELLDRLFGDKIQPYYEKLNRASFQAVFIFRVLPVTPYRLFNFASGVTDLKWMPYLVGSAAGIFLRTLFFQFLFTLFGDELVDRGITVGQLLIFSIVLTPIMLLIWFLYKKRKSNKNSKA